ncbi:hypothetical protein HMI54_001307 [Coelomomyces lativittatus]|nr:hypothetical protein HMI55_003716 [Coelomomyces lativittatus]KAJ1508569.1 hypothetical protein HMI56_007232 [Coelomomyces lativittatus]KAJ1510830.1 hypothetical protein HMI54_001307 [Coelomomyces lativittatus]
MSWGDPQKLLESLFECIREGRTDNITLFSSFNLSEIDWVTLFHCIVHSPTPIRTLQLSDHSIKGKALVSLQDYLLDTAFLESLAVFPKAAADDDLTPLLTLTRNPHSILTHLDLSNKSIHGSAPNLCRLISNLPSLREFNLAGNKGIHVLDFPTPLSLHTLVLSDCELTNASLLPWLHACPELTSLDISNNPEIDDALFENTSISAPNLSKLFLQNTGLSHASFSAFSILFPRLEHMDISLCRNWLWSNSIFDSPSLITHLSMKGILSPTGFIKYDLKKLPNLKYLDISDCALQSSDTLLVLLEHPSLDVLIFANNSLIPFNLEVTTSKVVSCTRVDLTATQLTLRWLSVLIQLYPSISTWEVSANPLCHDAEAMLELIDEYPGIRILWR